MAMEAREQTVRPRSWVRKAGHSTAREATMSYWKECVLSDQLGTDTVGALPSSDPSLDETPEPVRESRSVTLVVREARDLVCGEWAIVYG
jgi:hypothetical protein